MSHNQLKSGLNHETFSRGFFATSIKWRMENINFQITAHFKVSRSLLKLLHKLLWPKTFFYSFD